MTHRKLLERRLKDIPLFFFSNKSESNQGNSDQQEESREPESNVYKEDLQTITAYFVAKGGKRTSRQEIKRGS